MLRPPYLQAGDKVALISPAGTIAPECIEYAEKILCSWGLIPVRGRYATSRHNDLPGAITNAYRICNGRWMKKKSGLFSVPAVDTVV